MEDDLNGRQIYCKMTSMEDNLNGRKLPWKTTSIEADLNLRLEDDLNEIQPQ